MTLSKKKIIVVGGGPAGMMAAIELSKHHEVHLYEKGKTLGRKFLVAGKGGFNLTNSAINEELLNKYHPKEFLKEVLSKFDSKTTRSWLLEIGIPTYIGSSGRVFPIKGTKPIDVLNALKDKILEHGSIIYFEHEFVDFNEKKITFSHKNKELTTNFDHCIFALGGASWSITGSKGDWLPIFEKNKINTKPFEASNCGLVIDFPKDFIKNYSGLPLKNIAIASNGYKVKGEAVITAYGLEGNAIYPIAAHVRHLLNKTKKACIQLDLKPHNTIENLRAKITDNLQPKNYAYTFKLNKLQLALLKLYTDKETYLTPHKFVEQIKSLEIPIKKLRPIEEAISTVGGINISELNNDLSLKKIPNIYIAGEMFDWDTITGGYLLQGCFSTGYHVAQNILKL